MWRCVGTVRNKLSSPWRASPSLNNSPPCMITHGEVTAYWEKDEDEGTLLATEWPHLFPTSELWGLRKDEMEPEYWLFSPRSRFTIHPPPHPIILLKIPMSFDCIAQSNGSRSRIHSARLWLGLVGWLGFFYFQCWSSSRCESMSWMFRKSCESWSMCDSEWATVSFWSFLANEARDCGCSPH